MGDAPDPELTSRMQKPCTKSRHPNVHICKKQPKTKFARKIHENEAFIERKNRTKSRYWKRKKGLKPKSLSRRKIRVFNV